MMTNNKKRKVLEVNYAEICFFILVLCVLASCFFPAVSGFSDKWLRPKWMLTGAMGAILVGWLGVNLWMMKAKELNSSAWLQVRLQWRIDFAQAIVVVATLESMYAIGRYVGGQYMISGTFDNPSGLAFCLCASLPFFIFLAREGVKNRSELFVLITGGLFVITAILCSQSRTGMIYLFFFSVSVLWRSFRHNTVIRTLLFLCVGGLLAWGVVTFKKDSTSGRCFILERSWELVQACPLKGYGPGGFHREYMLQQANYFRQHPESKYAWLASEINHPLNEFVLVWIEYGIGGLLFLLCLFAWLGYTLYRRVNGYSNALIRSLMAVFIFSCFSYPFKYPLSVVVITACIVEVVIGNQPLLYHNRSRLRLTGMVMSFFSLMVLVILSITFRYENAWSRVAHHAISGHSREVMTQYERLAQHYSRNAMFLYNYAAEQFYAERFESALITAQKCMTLWPSYNLSLLSGDICRATGRMEEASAYYCQAHWMCPVRFAPLEGLYYAYKELGDREKADSVAQLIIHKQVKVNSADVQRIKAEIQKDLEIKRK